GLGPSAAVQDVRLLVQGCLGRVQVLGAIVVVEYLAGAEPDDVAAEVADRPEQAPAEPVDEVAGARLLGQASRDQLGRREALLPQVLRELVPAVGGEAAAVRLGGLLVEATLSQELPCRSGGRARQLGRIELGGGGVRCGESLALAGRLARRRPGLDVPQLDAGLRGKA